MSYSEQGRYAAQTWPCYGVTTQPRQLETAFLPWSYRDGVVLWGPAQSTEADALAVAKELMKLPR